MSDQSPLFVSSTELIAHSIELYTRGNERKYKFIILHLANSIELILKDRLIDAGESIYNSPTHTIGIRDAFRELAKKSITIPERPVIELLIDDRNTIQHRFGFPDADTVFYYLDEVLGFFERFLNDEYDVDLVEVLRIHVSEDDLSVVGLIEQEDESEPLDKLYQLSPEAAVLRGYTLLERRLIKRLGIQDFHSLRRRSLTRLPPFRKVLRGLSEEDYFDGNAEEAFIRLRELRNRAAHSTPDPEGDNVEWDKGLEDAKELIEAVSKADGEEFFDKYRERFVEFEEKERERLEALRKRHRKEHPRQARKAEENEDNRSEEAEA